MILKRKSTRAWCAKHVTLGGVAFDPAEWPGLGEILDTMDERRGCTILVLGSIQSWKTLGATLWNLASVWLRPGPAGWYLGSDDALADWAKSKFLPLLDSVKPLNDMLTSARQKTLDGVSWPHMRLGAYSIGKLLNRNSKSLQHVTADEPWAFEPGYLGEVEGRMTSFDGRERLILTSSGPTVGSEVHRKWENSNQQTLHVPCDGCGRWVDYGFFRPAPIALTGDEHHAELVARYNGYDETVMRDDVRYYQPPGGLLYDIHRNADESINWQKTRESARYQCPHCGHVHKDDAAARLKRLKKKRYIALNPGGDPDIVAFHWNALCHFSWGKLVEQWIDACHAKNRGDTSLFEDFYRKRLALPYDPRLLMAEKRKGSNAGSYVTGEPWPEEKLRIMTIDVQMDHFWYVVRGYAANTKSRLIECGRCEHGGELREIQQRLNVSDHGGAIVADPDKGYCFDKGAWVFIDGNHFPSRVRQLAAAYNWVVLRGEAKRHIRHRDGYNYIYAELNLIDAFEGSLSAGRMLVGELRYAEPWAREILWNWREHPEPDFWTYSRDIAERCPAYLDQLESWTRISEKHAKDEGFEFKWKQIKADDHLWDCEKMQVVGASMAELVAAPVKADGTEQSNA